MIWVADAMADAFPGAHFYTPDAPFAYDPANDPKNPAGPSDTTEGRHQWYSRVSEQTRQEGLYALKATFDGYIAELTGAHGLDASRCAVIGMSMGCIVGLHYVPRRDTPLAAFVGHSAYLFSPDSLAKRRTQVERFQAEVVSRTPTAIIHGLEDTTQPWQNAVEATLTYEDAKIPVELHLLSGLGHTMASRSVTLAAEFIGRQLASA